MSKRGVRSAAFVLLVIIAVGALAASAAAGGYLITHRIRTDRAAGERTSVPVPGALTAATAAPRPSASPSAGPLPTPAGVAAALRGPAAAPGLGGRLLAQVVDAATGTVLLGRGATTAAAPASTAKLLTAVALLSVRAPSERLTTSVVDGGAGTVVLVGGGDPTLSGAAPGAATRYPGAARLGTLADQVRATGVRATRIVVDGSLFTGPATSPYWAPGDVPTDYAAPITAVLADGGRDAPGDTIRSTAPDLAAGRRLAALLGVPATAVSRGTAPAGARVLASVRSAPLSALVEQMLQPSDNVIAECLARQVAIARHAPASFLGATAAIRSVLDGLGVDVGPGMRDGSGLAATDHVSPAALVAVLRLAVGDEHPALHDLVTALPVAGWSGTLADRYLPGEAGAAGAGVVRAKTGTLTSVSALAGLVHDTDGRLLVFALIADRVPAGTAGTDRAEAALDTVAATLAGCGCH